MKPRIVDKSDKGQRIGGKRLRYKVSQVYSDDEQQEMARFRMYGDACGYAYSIRLAPYPDCREIWIES